MWYHAFTRVGADGTQEDGLFQMLDTPTGIATIFSEVVEVNQRRTSINWLPGAPRTYHTAEGNSLPLIMTNNGLGWLRLRPITDGRRIKSLLMNSGISVVTPIYNQPSVDIATQSVDTVHVRLGNQQIRVGNLQIRL